MLDHLGGDLESDFSAVHRVRDITALDGPTFYRLAWRLPAYQGVMQARAREWQQENEPAQPSRQVSSSPARQVGSAGRDVIPGTKVALQAHPELQGIFSFSSASASG